MLKDLIHKDVQEVFFNTNELAEIHRIGNKPVRCIIDNERLYDISQKYHEGTFTAEKLIYINERDIDGAIGVNDTILFDDEISTVYSVSSEYGMIELMLNKPIGKLDKDVTIQIQSGTTKVNGFKTLLWQEFYSCKAYIRNVKADDVLKRGTTVNSSIILIKIPYKEGVTSKMRLIYKDITYDITSVDNIEENNLFMNLICEVSL